jgi:hypothetical protein
MKIVLMFDQTKYQLMKICKKIEKNLKDGLRNASVNKVSDKHAIA